MYTKLKGTADEDNISVDEFVDKREYYHMEAVSRAGIDYFKDFFKRELRQMPGATPMAKLQNHYLSFMETIHHSTYFTTSFYGTVLWVPLLSKELFHLNNVTGMVFRDNRLAFDLMELLNPVVAAVPYEKELYNSGRRALVEEKPRLGRSIEVPASAQQTEREKWEAARLAKRENMAGSAKPKEELAAIELANRGFQGELRENALVALHKIVNFDGGRIGDVVGLECFSRIHGEFDLRGEKAYINFLYTKLISLYHEMKIFGLVD